MFSLFSKSTETVAPAAPAPSSAVTNEPAQLMRAGTVLTVSSGIKAEQERSDILHEQLVFLSEKAAQAFDRVAEKEAENARLLQKVKNLESLLAEKNSITKRKTTNDELLELKMKNTILNDKVLAGSNEISRLKREMATLKNSSSNSNDKTRAEVSDLNKKVKELHKENSDISRENSRLFTKNKVLQSENISIREENAKLNSKIDLLKASAANKTADSLLHSHERENSISSVSSKSSTVFSYMQNSSTEDISRSGMSSLGSDSEFKSSGFRKEMDIIYEKLNSEKQKRHALMASFKHYQEKTAILADFNTNYIQELTSKIQSMKSNEERLKMKIDLYQTNMNLIQANKSALYH